MKIVIEIDLPDASDRSLQGAIYLLDLHPVALIERMRRNPDDLDFRRVFGELSSGVKLTIQKQES